MDVGCGCLVGFLVECINIYQHSTNWYFLSPEKVMSCRLLGPPCQDGKGTQKGGFKGGEGVVAHRIKMDRRAEAAAPRICSMHFDAFCSCSFEKTKISTKRCGVRALKSVWPIKKLFEPRRGHGAIAPWASDDQGGGGLAADASNRSQQSHPLKGCRPAAIDPMEPVKLLSIES